MSDNKGSLSTKECFKMIYRWLSKNYNKEVEESVFNIEKELDMVNLQLEAELKFRRDNDNDND